jgi:hypothetical protein
MADETVVPKPAAKITADRVSYARLVEAEEEEVVARRKYPAPKHAPVQFRKE